ncbi:50S ribosomal protein L25/general stress protein Ctc [Nakamurella endophytica]|uniref:Large ribosomal subunit protein bL25 n=1 Tax=Nakamurella endophytica TaxID=1748367 RepID=A0A917WA48_9ACTN|nr:50S ribosomal protein L25/general stress protein Ctc [Nakamurella endophytica]GGL87586.1 50S ribosomal protein L25 [Nakamurella endophytica]
MSESPAVRLVAEKRTEFGKGGARRTRRAGKIPAVLYGHGNDPRHLSLPAREFAAAIKHGANTVLTLVLDDGASELALAKSVVRHPLRDYVEHVDLISVRRGEKVTVDVPVTVVGEPAPGALVLTETNTLSVEADALTIPAALEVSVQDLAAGTQITAAQVSLPEGATLQSDAELLVVAVQAAPTAEDIDAEMAEAEAEAGVERDEPESTEDTGNAAGEGSDTVDES